MLREAADTIVKLQDCVLRETIVKQLGSNSFKTKSL
jgi:hypothetical protein